MIRAESILILCVLTGYGRVVRCNQLENLEFLSWTPAALGFGIRRQYWLVLERKLSRKQKECNPDLRDAYIQTFVLSILLAVIAGYIDLHDPSPRLARAVKRVSGAGSSLTFLCPSRSEMASCRVDINCKCVSLAFPAGLCTIGQYFRTVEVYGY